MENMNLTLLTFGSIDDLKDFEKIAGPFDCEVDQQSISLKGAFQERDIEFAKSAFHASVNN
jgi:hypothetical protein